MANDDRPTRPGWATSPAIRWIALLGLVSAYLQGGIDKLVNVPAAVGEMQHFGLEPAQPLAIATIAFELLASIMVLSGLWRWLAALALAAFTLAATFIANRFWQATGVDRFALENGFFEHLGLVGGFLLVAWMDLRERAAR